MNSRRVTAAGVRTAALGAAGVLVLAACGSTSAPTSTSSPEPTATVTATVTPTPHATISPGSPAPSTPAPQTAAATATATPTASGSSATVGAVGPGCVATSGGIPAHASRRSTIDVDGDGKRDTVWSTEVGGIVRIGITTASGATFSTRWDSASPVRRTVLVARATASGPPLLLADDGRAVDLFTVAECGLVPVTNIQGAQYRFDLGPAGNGTGVGCLGPGDAPGLTGLNAVSSDRKHYTITRTFVNVVGTKATNGRRDILQVTLPAGAAAVASAMTVTCGDLTIDHDGLAAPQT